MSGFRWEGSRRRRSSGPKPENNCTVAIDENSGLYTLEPCVCRMLHKLARLNPILHSDISRLIREAGMLIWNHK